MKKLKSNLMKKQVLLFLTLALCLFGLQANAQNLQPGDIVVIGIGSDTGDPSPNFKTEFSWVPLVNLTAGTQFYFTDAGWNNASNEFMSTGLNDEILLRFTVPSGGILAGVVQIVSESGTNSNYTVISGTKCGSDSDGKLSLPNAGDSVIVFKSTATVDANFPGTNFTALFAVTSNTTDWASMTTTTGTTVQAFKDNYSNLPPGLTNGVNAVAVGLGPGQSDEADNVRFQGNTSGSKAVLLARICTESQWVRYDTATGNDFNGSTPVLGWTTNGVTNFSVAGADITPPSVQSITLVGSPAANSSSISYTVTFSESANNISTDDFQITTSGTSGTIFSVSAASGTSVTVTINNISGTGTLRLDLKSNTNITDATGNGNNTNGYVSAYSSGSTHNVDRDAPTLTITSSSTNPTNLNPIPITFTFSENVTGFDSTDVTVTGGNVGSVSGTGNSYTANITPSGDGTITVNVAAGRVIDAANNGNTAATQLSRTSDRTAPTVVSMNASVGNPNNATSFTLTITFSESVSNFISNDITMTNAGLSNFSGSGTTYSVTVTPNANGTVTANIGSNVANDAAGNGNTASSQFSTVVDRTQPSVSIGSSVSAGTTNSNPIPITITFSESVNNFIENDISVTNGSISSFTVNSGSSYSFNLNPSSNGTVTVNVSAGVANDAAGNTNTAATQFSKTFDNVSPSVSITSSTTSPTNSNSFSLTFTFSESVSNFIQNDIAITNAGLSSFQGTGSVYTVTVTPSSDGTVTANIGSNVANDAAGNGNSAASQFSMTVDRSQPTVSITSSVSQSVTNTNPIPITITFSESVQNFIEQDINVGNGTISGFTQNSGSNYSFNLNPSSNGTVTVNVSSAVANDAAGNSNTAAMQFSKIFDNTNPTLSITSVTSSPTNSTSIPITITFSESVSGFDSNDITSGNGSISGFSGSGANYSFTLTPTSPGAVTISIVGGIAFDSAGNGNTAATQFSITYDNSQPTVTIGSAISNPTNSNSIPVTFTFNEAVSGFGSGDVSVINGSLSDFIVNSSTSYSATLTPSAAGTITLNINAGSAIDAAGNGNTASNQFSIVYDNVQPTVSISSPVSSPTNVNSFTVNFNFSESVNNFTENDVVVGNGTLSNFSGSGSSYSATVTPTLDGTVTVNIAASVANDLAGNGNTAATQFSIVSDRNGPTLSITSTATSPTNANTILLTFTFSENVTGFASSDITPLGGTISDFSGSGSVYTVNLTPTADGSLTVFVFQNNAVDSAGNGNTFATFSIMSDRTKPTVTITSTESTPTSTNPIPITFNFSENTTNFIVNDITVTGGTLTNFSGSGSTYSVDLIPSGTGSKTIRLLANVMSDAAGNTNNASGTFSIYYLPPCSQTTTWNGLFWTNGAPIANQPAVIAADYSSNENFGGFSACSLIVGNNAIVTIESGHNITITGNVNVQNGSTLTFESGSNLIQTGTVNNNSGSIIYKRETTFRRLDYTFWSSPVAGQNLKLFSPETVSPPVGASRFYVVNEATNGFVAIDPETNNFTAAKGYMLRAPNYFTNTPASWTGEFVGVPNNGNINIDAFVTNVGSNLIGNPYPSTISADLFLAANPGTLYFWTHSNSTQEISGSYATYNEFGSADGVNGEPFNGFIQAGQGFIYQPSATTTAHFTNSMRVANNDNQFFRNPITKHRFWINLNNQTGLLNQILIGYMDGATEGNDISLDGKSLANGSSISSLINTDKYAIQARSMPFVENDIVPLSFKAESDGNYSLSLDHFDGLFLEDQSILLKDNLTGILHNLKQGTYNFVTASGEFSNRFAIVYQSVLNIKNPVVDQNSIIIYNENGTLKINSGETQMSAVKVFDIRGRLLLEKNDINSSATSLIGLSITNQVLIVQITANNTIITRKVVY